MRLNQCLEKEYLKKVEKSGGGEEIEGVQLKSITVAQGICTGTSGFLLVFKQQHWTTMLQAVSVPETRIQNIMFFSVLPKKYSYQVSMCYSKIFLKALLISSLN